MTELDLKIKDLEAQLEEFKQERKLRNESAIRQTINSIKCDDGSTLELVAASQNIKILSIHCPAFVRTGNSCRAHINISCEDVNGRAFNFFLLGDLEGKKTFSCQLRPSNENRLFENKLENGLFTALVKYRLLKILRMAVCEMSKTALLDPAKNSELVRIGVVLDSFESV